MVGPFDFCDSISVDSRAKMDTPKEIRLLERLKKFFPEWVVEQQARTIERAFQPELRKARNDPEARYKIERQREFEVTEYWDELAQLRSRKLVKQARKLHIPLGPVKWETGNYGHNYLADETETHLYREIREENRKIWEFRIKAIIALTGLLGTLIGVLTVLSSFWKK